MRHLRSLVGLALVGYGLLVVLRILAHEALLAGLVSLTLGAGLLFAGVPSVQVRRASLVAGLGAGAVGGVLIYNLATGSGLSMPEWGLLLYGVGLLAASRHLGAHIGKTEVGTLVGWSFPILFTPLFLFAIHAIIAGPAGVQAGTIADPLIGFALVAPMAAGLELFGTPNEVIANNILIETSRGTLTLGVGLVCAGLYPMVLFLGVLGLHAWQTGLDRRRFGFYLGAGLVGLYLTNLLRLMLLAKIGEHWGAASLQTAHAHLGWVLFAGFMVLFWFVVVRHFEAPKEPDQPVAVPAPSDR